MAVKWLNEKFLKSQSNLSFEIKKVSKFWGWKFEIFEDLEWKIEKYSKIMAGKNFYCVGVGGGGAMLKTWKRGHFGIKSNKY